MKKLVIATRESKLAMWQSRYIKNVLEDAHEGLTVELKTYKTKGDKMNLFKMMLLFTLDSATVTVELSATIALIDSNIIFFIVIPRLVDQV